MTVPAFDEYTVHVELGDTDAFGVIFWGTPIRWMQRGYENLARAAGHPVEEMLSLDHDHPVVKANMEYRRPLRLGDRLRVRTYIARVGNRSFDAVAKVFGPDNELAVEVTCVHVCASRTGGSARLDEWVRQAGVAAAAGA